MKEESKKNTMLCVLLGRLSVFGFKSYVLAFKHFSTLKSGRKRE